MGGHYKDTISDKCVGCSCRAGFLLLGLAPKDNKEDNGVRQQPAGRLHKGLVNKHGLTATAAGCGCAAGSSPGAHPLAEDHWR